MVLRTELVSADFIQNYRGVIVVESDQKLNVQKALCIVQANMRAEKGRYNNFGKYHYRTKEDLQRAFKDFAVKFDEGFISLTVTDEIVQVGDRFYIKAVATFTFIADGHEGSISAIGWAREPEVKKGMDASQITGATSSYAGKYAIANLFCCDDSEADPDHRPVVKDDHPPALRYEPQNNGWS